MLVHRHQRLDAPGEVRRLIEEYGFATLASADENGTIRATHMPCRLDPEAAPDAPLTILGHVARADPQAADILAERELLLVFQGPHGYISPSWYEAGPYVSTWNYVAVHVRGTPQVLEGEDALSILRRTTDQFERARSDPFELDSVIDFARKILKGTVCFRLVATDVEAKAKLSQDKPAEVRARVIASLEEPGPFHQPELARAMRRLT